MRKRIFWLNSPKWQTVSQATYDEVAVKQTPHPVQTGRHCCCTNVHADIINSPTEMSQSLTHKSPVIHSVLKPPPYFLLSFSFLFSRNVVNDEDCISFGGTRFKIMPAGSLEWHSGKLNYLCQRGKHLCLFVNVCRITHTLMNGFQKKKTLWVYGNLVITFCDGSGERDRSRNFCFRGQVGLDGECYLDSYH